MHRPTNDVPSQIRSASFRGPATRHHLLRPRLAWLTCRLLPHDVRSLAPKSEIKQLGRCGRLSDSHKPVARNAFVANTGHSFQVVQKDL